MVNVPTSAKTARVVLLVSVLALLVNPFVTETAVRNYKRMMRTAEPAVINVSLVKAVLLESASAPPAFLFVVMRA